MKERCVLCDEAMILLQMLQHEYSFDIEERDIYAKDEWLELYQIVIPVIEVNDEQISGVGIDYETLESFLKRQMQ